jgi:glycerophosphoryl diester phosphodiesterase
MAWTVDDAGRIRELLGMGVDGICSNDPRLFQVAEGKPHPALEKSD